MPSRFLPPLLCFLSLLAATDPLQAQGTKLWSESSAGDWEKGVPSGVAISSDGTLSTGLAVRTVAQLGAADVWAATSDSQGNAYVATGSPAQVVRIAADGKQTVLFTTKDLSVQALQMAPDGALYAATLPSAKVFRLDPHGTKPMDEATAPVVFDAGATVEKPKYLWALRFDGQGRLYVATGAPGLIYRVGQPGANASKPELFFASDEPHIRSLLLRPDGSLLAGSDGSGLVYEIDAAGKGQVLFEAGKREITALALGAQGQLYVAAVGEKGHSSSLPPLPVAGAGAAPTASITVTVVQPGSAQAVSTNAAIPDGSEVSVVPGNAAEAPRRLWAAHEDVVYGLLPTPEGLLAATGNRGRVYRLQDDGSIEDVAHGEAGQVIGFTPGPGNSVYLPAANTGRLLQLQLAPAPHAMLLSDVFDAQLPALWGRAEVTAAGGPASYLLEARTGNIDNPARGWSEWHAVKAGDAGLGSGQSQAQARFAQWRLTLQPEARVSAVALNYLPANAAPEVDEILVAPGTKVNTSANQASYPTQTTLNFASQGGAPANLDNNSAAAPLSAFRDKDSITVRWAAHDDNGDELRFALYFKGQGDTAWRLLKKDLTDRFLSFDANLLPDGPYRLRVVATDAPSHAAGQALTGERVSELFLVDTATPEVKALLARRAGGGLHVTATATDAKMPIARSEYSLDAGPWQLVEPVGRLSDALEERYDFLVPLPADTAPGAPHIVTMRTFDRYENSGSARVPVP